MATSREAVLVAAEAWEIQHAPGMFRKIITGVGRVSMDLNGKIVVNAGVCGALDPALVPGDIVVVTAVNGAQVLQPSSAPSARRGALMTVDRIVATPEEKRRLREETGAMVVDMEAAAILERVGASALCCIKVVLDTADERFALDLNAALVDGSFSRAVIARQALRRPLEVIPELFRLKRRRDAAAKMLGEFLGKCSF